MGAGGGGARRAACPAPPCGGWSSVLGQGQQQRRDGQRDGQWRPPGPSSVPPSAHRWPPRVGTPQNDSPPWASRITSRPLGHRRLHGASHPPSTCLAHQQCHQHGCAPRPAGRPRHSGPGPCHGDEEEAEQQALEGFRGRSLQLGGGTPSASRTPARKAPSAIERPTSSMHQRRRWTAPAAARGGEAPPACGCAQSSAAVEQQYQPNTMVTMAPPPCPQPARRCPRPRWPRRQAGATGRTQGWRRCPQQGTLNINHRRWCGQVALLLGQQGHGHGGGRHGQPQVSPPRPGAKGTPKTAAATTGHGCGEPSSCTRPSQRSSAYASPTGAWLSSSRPTRKSIGTTPSSATCRMVPGSWIKGPAPGAPPRCRPPGSRGPTPCRGASPGTATTAAASSSTRGTISQFSCVMPHPRWRGREGGGPVVSPTARWQSSGRLPSAH